MYWFTGLCACASKEKVHEAFANRANSIAQRRTTLAWAIEYVQVSGFLERDTSSSISGVTYERSIRRK
jgi:hypothetical protein